MHSHINASCIAILFLFLSLKVMSQTDSNTPYLGITVYISYPDAPVSVSAMQLDSLINGVNYTEVGVTRSFRKYWYDETRRNVVMHHDVFFYTAPLPSTHYDTIPWYDGILLWKDALEYVIATYPAFDWNTLSQDAYENVKSVMIISSKWGPAGVGGAHGPNWTLSNGVKIGGIYGTVLWASWDVANNMFMTLHEAGHGIFGFPDTYDTDYNSGGTSFYCLMSGGQPDVEPLGGPFLVQSNWGNVLEPGPGTHSITLKADGDEVAVFRNLHDSLEFFTIEARKQDNIGNSLFPAALGLLVWHTDSKVSTSNTLQDMTPMKHYRHSIEQADGLFELEGPIGVTGDIGDIYLPGSSFTNTTIPNTKWWDGSASDLELTNIQLIGMDSIRFDLTIPTKHVDHHPEIPQTSWSLVSATTPQAGYEGEKAFDGNWSTYYHVPWGNTYPRPHEIVIDLGKEYKINEFYYTANDNFSPPWEGRIEDYKIYISSDTLSWGSEVAIGTFFQTGIKQYALFAETTGRYIKFSALNSFGSDVRTSIAEINLKGFDPALISVDEIKSKDEFQLYPNPTTGSFKIELPTEMAEISVVNLNGQLLTKIQATEKIIDFKIENSGVYIIYVKTAKDTKARKLIVNQ